MYLYISCGYMLAKTYNFKNNVTNFTGNEVENMFLVLAGSLIAFEMTREMAEVTPIRQQAW